MTAITNKSASMNMGKSAASPWPVFWIASIAVFLVSLDSTMLFAAFGAIRSSYASASPADLSWVLNAYTVVYAALLIPAGGLADAHGRKRTFLFGVTLFLAASAACGLAPNVGWLIAARVAQAVGAALLTPASLSLVLEAFPSSKRSLAVSVWGAVGGLAAAIGPSLGSWVIDAWGWRWAFYLNLPLGAISLWRGARLLKKSQPTANPRRLDLVGITLLIVAVGAIALSIVESDAANWQRSDLLAAAATGLTAFIAFVAWIRHTTSPLVDPVLFRYRTYRFVNVATLAFGISFSIMFFTFFFYMTQVWHYSLPRAGLAITPGPLIVMPVAIVSGRRAAQLGHRPFLVVGSLIYGAAGLWFLLMAGTEPSYLLHWLPGQLLSGIGVGLVMPALSGAAVSRLPAEHYAVGSAVNQATRQIGSVIGVALTVLLIGHAGVTRTDFTPLYIAHMGLALLTAVLCLAINTKQGSAGN